MQVIPTTPLVGGNRRLFRPRLPKWASPSPTRTSAQSLGLGARRRCRGAPRASVLRPSASPAASSARLGSPRVPGCSSVMPWQFQVRLYLYLNLYKKIQ